MSPLKSSSMKNLGQGLHVSHSSKKLILRVTNKPRMGEPVYNRNGKKIGKIYDIFGPVERPFIAIETKRAHSLINKDLYIKKR